MHQYLCRRRHMHGDVVLLAGDVMNSQVAKGGTGSET